METTEKIHLNLSLKHMGVLISGFDILQKSYKIENRDAKVARIILNKIIERLKEKSKDKRLRPTVFRKGKKCQINLEIHEAHYLEKFVSLIESHFLSEYDRNVIGYVKSNINKQLE